MDGTTDWGSWLQNVGGSVVNKIADAKYVQPYEIQKLRLQALGEAGYYDEGQPGTAAAQRPLGLSSGALLIGGALLLFLLLKD